MVKIPKVVSGFIFLLKYHFWVPKSAKKHHFGYSKNARIIQHCRLNNNQTALNSRHLRASSDGPIPGRNQVLTKDGLEIA